MNGFRAPSCAVALLVAGIALGGAAPHASADFDAEREAANYAKQLERTRYDQGLEYQAQVLAQQPDGAARGARIVADDPDRRPLTTCLVRPSFCQGDPRLYDWEQHGRGREIQFVNRDGATIVGHLWAPPADADGGPPERLPGVMITNGFEFPEEYYWHAAQVLAQAGYLVMTWDTQGAGHSDSVGSGSETLRSVPALQGNPFYEGTKDALDFLLSTPDDPYVPRNLDGSRYAGGERTSGQAKQAVRVTEGRAQAYNPWHELLDRSRIGLAGHSYGAAAVSHVGQADERVDAIVSWDNIVQPLEPGQVRVPGLNFAEDYPTGAPYTQEPRPDALNTDLPAYRRAGVDFMQVNIRGGTHREYSYLPEFSDATLRGIDMVDWYTTAWFDRYLRDDPGADARLLTDRWRDDAIGAAVDPLGDGNLFSYHFRSPVRITRFDGRPVRCHDLRTAAGCDLVPAAEDGHDGDYSFLVARRRPSG